MHCAQTEGWKGKIWAHNSTLNCVSAPWLRTFSWSSNLKALMNPKDNFKERIRSTQICHWPLEWSMVFERWAQWGHKRRRGTKSKWCEWHWDDVSTAIWKGTLGTNLQHESWPRTWLDWGQISVMKDSAWGKREWKRRALGIFCLLARVGLALQHGVLSAAGMLCYLPICQTDEPLATVFLSCWWCFSEIADIFRRANKEESQLGTVVVNCFPSDGVWWGQGLLLQQVVLLPLSEATAEIFTVTS